MWIRSWAVAGALVVCLYGGRPLALAQQSGEPSLPPTGSPGEPSGEIPNIPGAEGPDTGEVPEYEIPEEYREEAEAAIEAFAKGHDEFGQALLEMRRTYVRFLNDEDRSDEARERYRQQRDLVRLKMSETFLAAMDVFRLVPDPMAAQFIATTIQHRAERDIYDEATAEGAARIIDARLADYLFLYQAGARSAVVAGKFEVARKLFDTIEEEQLEEVDRALMYQLEKLEADFAAEKTIREREIAEDRLPRVRFKTTRGEVVVELFIDQAPSTVANFINLVEDGFYDGLDFYQVIDHLLALTGDPSGLGDGNSGRALVDEHARPDARQAFRGSLVMAKLPIPGTGKFVPNSASSQFAILFLPLTTISEEQTVFGCVIEGMDVVSTLRRVDPSKEKKKTDIQVPPDRILSAEVIRRPESLPEPVFVK